MLPVTLRHVQGELRASGAAAPARPGRASSACQSDAEILAWFARLQRYHETQLTREELGLPQARVASTFEDDRDARGRTVSASVERRVGTRVVSLLAAEAGVRRLDAAAARRRRPAAVRGGRHSARRRASTWWRSRR